MGREVRVPIASDADIILARQAGRTLGKEVGLPSSELALVTTAISELARNIVLYAKTGVVELTSIDVGEKHGLVIIASDEGPGIADVEQAMKDGYSTGDSLGLGLPGARRMMDEFEIVSELGKGTRITMRKWLAGRR